MCMRAELLPEDYDKVTFCFNNSQRIWVAAELRSPRPLAHGATSYGRPTHHQGDGH